MSIFQTKKRLRIESARRARAMLQRNVEVKGALSNEPVPGMWIRRPRLPRVVCRNAFAPPSKRQSIVPNVLPT